MNHHTLKIVDLGIDTNQELVAFMPRTCHICKSEGFQSLTRLVVSAYGKQIFATLNVTDGNLLQDGEICLSQSALRKLNVAAGSEVTVGHFQPVESMSHLRSKIYGNHLNETQYTSIVSDIVNEKYSNIFLSAFVTACSGSNMTTEEICYLTKAMITTGNKLNWGGGIVADKHCIGGLPGNRTTMIVVPVIASLGIQIPKTSSRAITSPAGTADTMEVLTNVNLSLTEMKNVVEKEGGCIAWGGSVKLSPADDIIIRIERALDVDSEGQMIASILSKKSAAGATHCVIDIPVGATAKVRNREAALKLKKQLEIVASYIGLKTVILLSDGSQPVGRGIGPALEARDVLTVLRNEKNAPSDLLHRALEVAGNIIAMVKGGTVEDGIKTASDIISSGKAHEKLIAICHAQGGFKEPQAAKFTTTVESNFSGIVSEIDNRKIARTAKLAGAPSSPEAGIDLFISLNENVSKGQPLFVIHANSKGEMEYALDYYNNNISQTIKIQS